MVSVLDKLHVAGPRTLPGVLRRELNVLTLAQQLEEGPAHRSAVKEVIHPVLVPDETKTFVDSDSVQSCREASLILLQQRSRPPRKGRCRACLSLHELNAEANGERR